MLLSSYQQCCITVIPFCSFVAKLKFMIHDWRNSRPRMSDNRSVELQQVCMGVPFVYILYLAATDLFFFLAGWDSRHVGSGKSTLTCQLEVCWRKSSFTAVTTSFLDSIGISGGYWKILAARSLCCRQCLSWLSSIASLAGIRKGPSRRDATICIAGGGWAWYCVVVLILTPLESII